MTTSTCHAIVRNVRAPEGHIRIEGSAAFVQAELARYDQPCFEVVTDSSTERLPRLSEPVAERQRQVVALRILLGLSGEQSAIELGITAGSVGTHLHRALAALRPHVTPTHEEDPR